MSYVLDKAEDKVKYLVKNAKIQESKNRLSITASASIATIRGWKKGTN
jgi:hypothetical protein